MKPFASPLPDPIAGQQQPRQPARPDRRRAGARDPRVQERRRLTRSLMIFGSVGLAVAFLRLGVPEPAIVCIAVGFLLAATLRRMPQ